MKNINNISHFSKKGILFVLLCIAFNMMAFAQSAKQRELEAKRQRLLREIQAINTLIVENKSKTKSVVDDVQDIDYKIRVKRDLIKVINQQANLLTRQINSNQKKITTLRSDLKALKTDYAEMIRKSYKSKSQQSRIMFLLSSESFLQGYKRLQYMKQYANYRKKQGESIKLRTLDLQKLNTQLIAQEKEKQALLVQNRKVQKELEEEKKAHNDLLSLLRKDQKKYTTQVKKKQRRADELDRQIEKLIREAIAASNAKVGKTKTSKTFALTPEAKAIGNSFVANKGKLIWPIEQGIKVRGYGEYRDLVNPNVTRKNNGVTLSTSRGSDARAIYKGTVTKIFSIPGGKKGVIIRHGSYTSTYYNLSSVYVEKGKKVATKEKIGKIYTNENSGKTELKLFIFKDNTRLNPEHWIYRM